MAFTPNPIVMTVGAKLRSDKKSGHTLVTFDDASAFLNFRPDKDAKGTPSYKVFVGFRSNGVDKVSVDVWDVADVRGCTPDPVAEVKFNGQAFTHRLIRLGVPGCGPQKGRYESRDIALYQALLESDTLQLYVSTGDDQVSALVVKLRYRIGC